MKEHLTPQELMAALKRCCSWSPCDGCPNAVPGTEDRNGNCDCKFDLYDEMIHILESIIKKEE